MPRLIWVFAGRTCHFVGFVVRRLTLLQQQSHVSVLSHLLFLLLSLYQMATIIITSMAMIMTATPHTTPINIHVLSSGVASVVVVVVAWAKAMIIMIHRKHVQEHAVVLMWAAAWQIQQNDLCAQRRLRSAWASDWASAQSNQSLSLRSMGS